MRATASHGVVLDTVVPADALVGGVEGLAVLMAYALPQWLVASYAAVYVGVALAVIDESVAYLQRRVTHATGGGAGQASQGALTGLAAVRARIGRAEAQAQAARLVLEEAGRMVDAAPGEPETNRMVYRSKLLAGDTAMEVAATCTEACGLGALGRGSALERLYRDARSGAVMPPSSDVCADVLGTVALGLDPYAAAVKPW
jgi:alkylation response protein AidB-like acyl-CoA dehydrogenase